MADNIAVGVANAILAAMLQGTSFAGYSTPYVQLHNGPPGAGGTNNVANSGTRQLLGTLSTITGGLVSNTAAINWTSVSATETYTHVSLWSASSGGTFICSGPIATGQILVGQNFQIPAGSLSVSIPIAG